MIIQYIAILLLKDFFFFFKQREVHTITIFQLCFHYLKNQNYISLMLMA